jgi:hypothetical protein
MFQLIFVMYPPNFQIFVIQPILSQNSHITPNYLFIFYKNNIKIGGAKMTKWPNKGVAMVTPNLF